LDEFNTRFNNYFTELNLRIKVFQDVLEQYAVKFKHISGKNEELDSVQKVIISKNEKLSAKSNKQDTIIKEKSESLRNDVLELIAKSQRQMEKQYNNITKDLDSSKENLKGIVETTKEYTFQQISELQNTNLEILENFKIMFIQQQDVEKRTTLKEIESIKSDLTLFRQEFNKNDSILEKNLTELLQDFK